MATKTPRRRRDSPSPDAAAVALRAALRAHAPEAVAELARLAREATSEAARVAAINALIDRGFGDLRRVAEPEEPAPALTVRFVAPSGKGWRTRPAQAGREPAPSPSKGGGRSDGT